MDIRRRILIVGNLLLVAALGAGVARDAMYGLRAEVSLGVVVTYFAMIFIGLILIGVGLFEPKDIPVDHSVPAPGTPPDLD